MSAESLSFASTPSSPPSPSTPSTPGFRASFGSFSISLTFDLGGLGAEEAGGPTNRNSIASSVSSASSTNSSSSVGSNGHGNGGGPGSSRSSARFDRVISSDGNGLRLDLTGIEDAGSNNKPSWSPLPHEEPFGLEDTAQEDHLYDDGRLQLNGDEGDTVTAAAATLEADVIAKPSSRRLKTFLYSPTTASFASSASSSLHDLGLTLTNSENGKLELGAMAIDGRPFTGSGGAGGSGARRTGLGARAAAAARLEEINTARANSATNYSDRLSPLSSAGSSLRRPATASPTTMSAPASPRIWLNSPWTGSRAGSSHNYHPFYHFGDAASSTDERPSSSKMLMMSKLGGISAQARRRKPIRPRSGHSKAFGLVGVKAAGPGGAVTPPPPLTQRELEEFEALPIAIRRKYFSTLERLRFAQTSGMLGAAAAHENHLEGVAEHSASKRPQTNHSRPANDEHHLAGRRRRRSLLGSQSPSSDTVWLDDLPDKIREKHLSPSEQAALVRRLRDSVILDAADEAIYKIGRQAARNLTPQVSAPASESSARSSMDSIVSREAPAPRTTVAEEAKAMPDSFYESFRWLEQNEELDLRLYLEDQHTDVREELPPLSPSKTRGPSFRRHLSISKMPFSRSSVSSGRPSTKDVASPVSPSPASLSSAGQQHTRRRSRAMSLVTSKHGAQESISSIDQAAAHYQDPEARLKLRVYLASPQKFDEAIEFGFPSTDVVSPTTTKPEFRSPRRAEFQRGASEDAERLRTFLSDDRSSVYSEEEEEEMSVADPDSPKTPLDKPAVRPRVVTEPVQPTKPHAPDNYVHAPVSCREMTLRMTLTRPDLRAREEQIYGWQQRGPYLGRKSQQKQRDVNAPVTYLGEGIPKESIEQVFAGLDHWAPDPGTTVMKRFWNKVRRG